MADAAGVGPPRKRILVADDEPHIRRILASMFEGASFVVDPVPDGASALAALEEGGPYDLVLLDIVMPGPSGLEVLSKIRENPRLRETPVVILTAKGEDADRDEALSLGAIDFITKPFSPKKLLARVQQIVHGRP